MQIETHDESDSAIHGDIEKLRRVFINLIGNALDAFEQSGTPTPQIDIALGRSLAGNEVWVRIRDNGPGMDEATLERAFQPFFTSKANGTGLGLAISRKLIDAARRRDRAQLAPQAGHRVRGHAAARREPGVSPRILVVEDESAIRLALRGLLRRDGHDVDLAESGEAALAHARARLLRPDPHRPRARARRERHGRAARLARKERPETAVVMITAHGSEKLAVEAMKLGAQDYLPKPFDNDELRLVVQRALERTRLERENRQLLERVEREYGFGSLIGAGSAMRRVFETIQKVAETDLSVLVLGESGTGKELVAQALHQHSARRSKPFIAVNCAAISPELVESELFGHEKGSFTGADARRTGKFEAAHGGTIFLDEIGDMARETQAKVLRVLQERELERVGGSERIRVDVRVVAATHRDLEAEVERGRFREDLYYRLKVVELRIPPLRERAGDIPALAARFLEQIAERLKRPRAQLQPEALAALVRHPWRGNVRELRNTIEQAAVLCSDDRIGAADLRLPAAASAEGAAASDAAASELSFREAKRRATESFERDYLIRALREHRGNISRTAEALGMVRQSLQQKIRELALSPAEWEAESNEERDGADTLRAARRRSEP